jgi:uroporphyrinogen-III synthase
LAEVKNPSPRGRGWRVAPGEGNQLRRKPIRPTFVSRARHMRTEGTPAEKLAWSLLRNRRLLGLKFRRQVAIDRFIADFYCHELRLIIELDGDIHDYQGQIDKDDQRDLRLKQLGYQILRVANGMVIREPDLFVEEIRRFVRILQISK